MGLFSKKRNTGFVMVDVIVGIAMAGILLTAFTSALYQAIRMTSLNEARLKADTYLSEIAEISRAIEKNNWVLFSTSTCTLSSPCHFAEQSGTWVIATGVESLLGGTYVRTIIIEDVYRDTLTFPNQIVDTPGVLDPNTKKITGSVAWSDIDGSKTKELTLFVYDI